MAVLEDRGESLRAIPEWTLLNERRFDAVVSGVGKANAAGAVARVFDRARHGGVVSVGIAGALPGSGLELGSLVIAESSVYADEGLESPDRFIDVGAMGFAPLSGVGDRVSVGLTTAMGVGAGLAEGEGEGGARRGVIATVSTCAGTDDRAWEVVRRTGAIAEAMEGAAALFTARRLGGEGVQVAELRVISNAAGDRPRQRWDLTLALRRLGALAAEL